MAKEKKKKLWAITRIVREEYESQGSTRQEAIDSCNINGNPSSITVIKETAKIRKP